jgi:hypothetical protein
MQRGGRPLHDDVITQPNKYVVMQRGARPLYGDVGIIDSQSSCNGAVAPCMATSPFLSSIVIQRGGRSVNDGRHATGCSPLAW